MNDRRAQAPEKQHPLTGSVGPEPGSSMSLGLDSQGQGRVGWLGTVRLPALRGNSWGSGCGLHDATVGPLTAADASSQNERSAWPTVSVRHFSPVGNHFLLNLDSGGGSGGGQVDAVPERIHLPTYSFCPATQGQASEGPALHLPRRTALWAA